MYEGFYVTFTRTDGEIEEYFYWTIECAEEHFELFRNDDSGLYRKIELKFADTDEILDELVFQ